jgi:flavin-dependent dehydrogenase
VPYESAGEQHRGRIVLELGVVPGGYAWIFPKGDHVNVGVAGWDGEGPRLRQHLGRLLAAHGITSDAVAGLRGHRLPLRAPGSPLAGNRILLVGDAAGLVDPLSGDGIYEAVISADAAATAGASYLEGSAAALDAYAREVLTRLGPLCAASWEWKHAFDRFPRLSFGITRLPLAWSVIQELLRGQLVDPSASHGPRTLPILALSLLGRAASAPGAAYRREAARAASARRAVRHPAIPRELVRLRA